MEYLPIQKYKMLFTVVIAFILVLTLGLAYMSGGGYADLLLAATILIFLMAIARKVIFMPVEKGHE